MKKTLYLIVFLILSIRLYGQCDELSIKLRPMDKENLLHLTNDVKINVYPFFDEAKISKAYLEIYQVVGSRPLSRIEFEISYLNAIPVSVRFFDNPSPQFLLLRISKTKREPNEPLNKGIACLDTIIIKPGSLEEQAHALKNVVVDFSILLNNIPIQPSKISYSDSRVDSIASHQLFIPDAYLNTELTISYQDTSYKVWVNTKCRSNKEKLEINILPHAMRRLTEHASIIRLNQIPTLTADQKHRFLKTFPIYTSLFDPTIQFTHIKNYRVEHIILYKLSDEIGTHFVGADSSE